MLFILDPWGNTTHADPDIFVTFISQFTSNGIGISLEGIRATCYRLSIITLTSRPTGRGWLKIGGGRVMQWGTAGGTNCGDETLEVEVQGLHTPAMH